MIYTKKLQPDITLAELAEIWLSTISVSNINVDDLSTNAKRHFAAAPEWKSRPDGGLQTAIGNKKKLLSLRQMMLVKTTGVYSTLTQMN